MRGRFANGQRINSRRLPLYREYRRYPADLMHGSTFCKMTASSGASQGSRAEILGAGLPPRWPAESRDYPLTGRGDAWSSGSAKAVDWKRRRATDTKAATKN